MGGVRLLTANVKIAITVRLNIVAQNKSKLNEWYLTTHLNPSLISKLSKLISPKKSELFNRCQFRI